MKTSRALLFGALVWPGPSATADTWVEVRSPHFTVLSDAGEKKARETAREFEAIREVFRVALRARRPNADRPIVIYAVENEDGLKELIPSYWERSGPRPYGIFRPAPDKYLIALRTDAHGNERYQPIYHEYFHLLTRLNYSKVPVWAREGLAEFWENTVIRKNRVELGNPDWRQLEYLAQKFLIPLPEFLTTTENPHDAGRRRVRMFYAQAWALTHWTFLGEGGTFRPDLFEYLSRVEKGEDSVSAFEAVFGNLDRVEAELVKYARFPQKWGMNMELPVEVDEKAFAVRELDDAETLAVKASYLVSGRRRDHALPLLERALELDPASALALESRGYYHWFEGERDDADAWFAKAAAADSQSFLVHFLRAMAAKSEGDAGEAAVEAGFRRAIELNPEFAPAYAQLAAFYAERADRLRGAFDLAKKAVELEPEVAWYWINVGQILLRLGIPGEAEKAADRARAVASSDEDEKALASLEEQIQRHRAHAAKAAEAKPTPPPEPEPIAEEPPPPTTTTTTAKSTAPKFRYVRGTFREFRCIASDYFEFVISDEERTYVFFATSPTAIMLTDNGEATYKDLYCGRQYDQVEASYDPVAESPIGGKVDGKLMGLDFATP